MVSFDGWAHLIVAIVGVVAYGAPIAGIDFTGHACWTRLIGGTFDFASTAE